MIYSRLLCLIALLASRHVVVKDPAFSSRLNDPLRRINDICEGVASENHCPLEEKIEAKHYDTNTIDVISHYTQYKSQHGKNEQEIKSERVQHQ